MWLCFITIPSIQWKDLFPLKGNVTHSFLFRILPAYKTSLASHNVQHKEGLILFWLFTDPCEGTALTISALITRIRPRTSGNEWLSWFWIRLCENVIWILISLKRLCMSTESEQICVGRNENMFYLERTETSMTR